MTQGNKGGQAQPTNPVYQPGYDPDIIAEDVFILNPDTDVFPSRPSPQTTFATYTRPAESSGGNVYSYYYDEPTASPKYP